MGSKELRKLMNLHAQARSLRWNSPQRSLPAGHFHQTLRSRTLGEPGQAFKLNHRMLRDMRVLPNGGWDASYRSKRVTRLGVEAPLVAEEDVAEVYIGQELYPRSEREVWDMLQLPYRPYYDRNM